MEPAVHRATVLGDSRAAARSAGAGGLSARPAGHWFPLLLFGGLAALSLPLSVLFSPRLPAGIAVFTRHVYPTVTQAMYLGGGSSAGPFPFPLGWYWAGLLVTGSLLTAAWYRRRDRRTSSHTPLRGYLATGLALAAATAALPSLAGGHEQAAPVPGHGPGWTPPGGWARSRCWRWRRDCGYSPGSAGSRALAVITLIYTAAVCLAGWLSLRQANGLPAPYPSADPAALLPAAVLLLAGPGAMTGAGLRARAPTQPDPPRLFVTSPRAEQAFMRCQDRAFL